MGDSLERVAGYTRKTKGGKVVHVAAHTRKSGSSPMGKLRSLFKSGSPASAEETLEKAKAIGARIDVALDVERAKTTAKAKAIGDRMDTAMEGTTPDQWSAGGHASPKPGGALSKWYESMRAAKMDTFGRNEAKSLSDDELNEAIEEMEARVKAGNLGMSGSVDLQSLIQERTKREK